MQITNDVGRALAAAMAIGRASADANSAATTTSNTASTTTSTTTGTSTNPMDSMANEQTFLKLLVAQIQNQDPLQPTDSMQFVSQLAQFSSLEQLININQSVTTLTSEMGPKTTTNPPAGQ